MPTYKLTYFNFMGLAEPIRLILKYMGQEFEDVRIERSDWPQVKEAMPFGKVPVLKIDDKIVHQSVAICRYLGNQAGLGGKDNWENLQIDMLVDSSIDLWIDITKFYHEHNPEIKQKMKESLLSKTIPYYMTKYDKVIQNNGDYLVNGKLSWADIYITSLTDSINLLLKTDMVANYPHFKELKERVFSISKLKLWVEKNPKTDI